MAKEPSYPTNVVVFKSDSPRTITPKYTNTGITLQYSTNGGTTWTSISNGGTTTSSDEIWFRGRATGTKSLFTSYGNAWSFSGGSDNKLKVYGNLNFLLCNNLGDTIAPTSLANYCYNSMFSGCTSLTKAPELPARTLANYCYGYMFSGCTSLTTAPELPATTLKYDCYPFMFSGCTSLTTAPKLPATTLESYCYNGMFYGCTSLTTAPELPATRLETCCYYRMFEGCTSLTTAPKLPARTLATSCYAEMFYRCSRFKVSATQTGSYQYAWRIPTSGTGTTATNWNGSMLTSTGGTFKSDPTINTTYYVENPPV
jgi:hypothetical protein